MKNTTQTNGVNLRRGFASPFLLIALGVAIIGGAAYFYVEHKNAQTNGDQNNISVDGGVGADHGSKNKNNTVVLTKPIIKSMSRSSGPVGTKVTIYGLNFDKKVNGVLLTSSASPRVSAYAAYPASTDGKTIEFVIPGQLSSCPVSAPLCPGQMVATNRVTNRMYTVSVVTAAGSSNFSEFTVTTQ